MLLFPQETDQYFCIVSLSSGIEFTSGSGQRMTHMRIKHIFSLLALTITFLLAFPTLAQSQDKYPRQVRLNAFFDRDTTTGLSFRTIAPAYVVRNQNGFWHTLEINQVKFKRKESGDGIINIYGLGIRHQFDIPVGPRWRAFQLTAGTSERLGVSSSSFEPTSEFNFATTFFQMRMDIGVIPALHVYPRERLDVSLGGLFRMLDLSYTIWTNQNPTLPPRNQRQDVIGYGAHLFQFRSLILSVGYMF